jgi:glycosyltransferase involved in cell wall biosynthesis
VSSTLLHEPELVKRSVTDAIPVLFVIDQLCALGGAEKVLLRIVDRLPRERYAPMLVTFQIDHSLGIAGSISCPLYVYPLRRTYDWHALQVARKLRGLIRKNRVQITHTFHETSDLWAGPIAKLSGCPILISSRRDMGFNREPKHQKPYRWMGRYFNQVHTVSEQVRQRNIEQDGLDPNRVVTIYNGIDADPEPTFASKHGLRKRFGLEHATHLVSSVGNIRSVKGVDVFLRAAARVREQMPDVVFAIAGQPLEADYASRLKEMASTAGLGRNFVFLGPLADVRPLLRASDVFCLLSRSEGLSNALLEAMACQLPCVATAVGGNPEVVVDGKTGFVVRNEDHEAAAQSVLALLRDPASARSMGIEGRRVLEQKFTTETMMRSLIESYEQLLDDARRKNS